VSGTSFPPLPPPHTRVGVGGVLLRDGQALVNRAVYRDRFTLPSGFVDPGETLESALVREFEEETGVTATGPFIALTPVKQKGGKMVHARAFEGDCDPSATVSNTFTMEWPPKSGRQMEIPEMDRADFFDVAAAKRKIKAGQEALIEELQRIVDAN